MPIIGGGSSGSGAGVLAAVHYAPAALATYNVTGGTLVALDTTNLTVSFPVPSSLKAVVMFSAGMNGQGTNVLGLGLLNHSGGAQVGYTISNVVTATGTVTCTVVWYLSGLTAGTLGLDIAAGVPTAGTGHVFALGATGAVNNSNVGPAVITVFGV